MSTCTKLLLFSYDMLPLSKVSNEHFPYITHYSLAIVYTLALCSPYPWHDRMHQSYACSCIKTGYFQEERSNFVSPYVLDLTQPLNIPINNLKSFAVLFYLQFLYGSLICDSLFCISKKIYGKLYCHYTAPSDLCMPM